MKLSTPISRLPMVGPITARRLEKLNIYTINDLLLHIPNRYLDYRKISTIADAQVGEIVTIRVNVLSIKNIFTKSGKRLQLAQISDETGNMQAVWFNQIYLTRTIRKGGNYSFSGKIDLFNRIKSFISPD